MANNIPQDTYDADDRFMNPERAWCDSKKHALDCFAHKPCMNRTVATDAEIKPEEWWYTVTRCCRLDTPCEEHAKEDESEYV